MQFTLKQKIIVSIENKQMNDKVFFDTNTLIYVYSVDEQDKQQCVIERIQATKALKF